MQIRTKAKLSYLIFFLGIIFVGCVFKEDNGGTPYREDFFAMDTLITITLYDFPNSDAVVEKAKERLTTLENQMSVYIEESDVVKINKNAGVKPVKVHEDTFAVIQKAKFYWELTEGAFDITTYPIIKLWDVTGDMERIPTEDEIKEKLDLVNFKWIVLEEESKTVFLEKPNMEIDLGGIAKGYIGDELVRLFKEYGVTRGVVNLGGDVKAIGNRTDGTYWRIGVTNPRQEGGGTNYFAIVLANDESVVTSGDYERYMKDIYRETGVRFHHIFDPKTGYPSGKGIISTTVISDNAIDGDALATALFNMDAPKGIDFINGLVGVEALIINDEKEIFMTTGMKDKVQILGTEYSVG
jgi:thiamine biosynthesis lipoprotein